jgi:hypothetical protein
MSWYKLAKDYVNTYNQNALTQYYQAQDKAKFTNSNSLPKDNTTETDEAGLEKALSPERENIIKNPKMMNEIKQPVRVKATGQGSDALLNINKDMPIYNNGGNNFINTTDWNTN